MINLWLADLEPDDHSMTKPTLMPALFVGFVELASLLNAQNETEDPYNNKKCFSIPRQSSRLIVIPPQTSKYPYTLVLSS